MGRQPIINRKDRGLSLKKIKACTGAKNGTRPDDPRDQAVAG